MNYGWAMIILDVSMYVWNGFIIKTSHINKAYSTISLQLANKQLVIFVIWAALKGTEADFTRVVPSTEMYRSRLPEQGQA